MTPEELRAVVENHRLWLAGTGGARADLRCANLQYANLRGADLQYANLQYADLQGANLRGADLRGADLPAPTMLLLADWGAVSPGLCRELMRYDAANAPDGTKRFNAWVKGGRYPYADLKIQRVAYFTQDRWHWRPGPAKSAYDLMVMCLRERCKNSDYHEALGTKGAKDGT